MLRIHLLGSLDLRLDDTPLAPLESARAASLLAYLLLHRDAPQARQYLAFRLWPDSTESQARTNLRHVLHTLRHALPEPQRLLDVRTRTLQWRPHAPFWLDVAAFEAAIVRSERESGEAVINALSEAVDLYRGDLLEGSYDEWVQDERDRLRRRYLTALERLATGLEARGDHAQALVHSERLLRHDPLREDTYRLLMRLHDARGDRARALHVYHACAAVLERELGVQPSAATRDAYDALLPAERNAPPVEAGSTRPGSWPLVGRATEWARLTDLWRASERGRAQLVLVTGEPGVGKTRLVEELRSWAAHRGAATAEARSYRAEGALAYAPLVAWLGSEALAPRVARLERGRLSELARLVPELLERLPNLARPDALPEADQRQRMFDAAAHAILAVDAPLLLVADDIQWWDRETLQFLHYLLRVRPDAPVLVAATARREELDPHDAVEDLLTGLRTLDRCTELTLGRLTREETVTLAERISAPRTQLADAGRLYEETGGNPLFIVEAVRAGWPGTGAEPGRITPKVQAVIESRLAQLSTAARDLVGSAAVMGREFTAEMLERASDLDEAVFVRALDELWRRGIVRERGEQGYDFSHDRIREVAYLALTPAVRRHHHLRAAQTLERLHPVDTRPVSAQLAGHYERAGAADAAVSWYERAAQVAQELHANSEGVRLLERALTVVGTMPESHDRQRRELAILTALPAFVGAAEGFASVRMTATLERAVDLARALRVEPAAPLLRSLAIVRLSRGDFAEAQRLGATLSDRAEREADDVSRVEAEYVLGIAAFWQGDLEEARGHFESAVERYQPAFGATHLVRYGLDARVVCLSRLGNTHWFLGSSEAATAARDAALALAEEIGHPHTHAVALVFAATLALDMADDDRFREYAESLARENTDEVGPHISLAADAFSGYLDVLDGRTAAGLARIAHALHATQGNEPAPGMHAVLARVLLQACAVSGDADGGLTVADRVLATGRGIRVWEAEVRRLRATFLSRLNAPLDEVEAELARALHVAHRQRARSFERRIEETLVSLRSPRGDPTIAR